MSESLKAFNAPLGEIRILGCYACGSPLTRPVKLVSRDMHGVEEPNSQCDDPHQEIIEEGIAYQSRKPRVQSFDGRGPGHRLDFRPQYWLTPRDLLDHVGYSPIPTRHQGCCGLDGMDGPNRVCACGAEVGTEQSDCWTGQLFVPDPDTCVWIKRKRKT